ncbi:MAG TPA: dockerin type I domain-containing protein [Phycisphaerae bacterium]|nr:dockerin type I domain-containing protein [Phycisphaerae bacterium]HRY70364.1 dockerin type I domain-containing protein [Phycisphaerae bacterium]HSA28081.1 dockerin type I domain-containing protein [Phycisphaerae bacterium]
MTATVFSIRRAFLATAASVMPMSAVALADGNLLAGYEPSEVGAVTIRAGSSDPGLTVAWPVEGGVGGVPTATEGRHVLKLHWSGETDRKVQVRHEWFGRTFDLPGMTAGIAEIKVDVYVASPSALAQTAGIWDDVLGWTAGCPVPTAVNQWFTVSMNVGQIKKYSLSHIAALLFENLAGSSGTIYLDYLRLVPTRQIRFAGRDWIVKSGDGQGPGPNDFSQSEENVWVDASGRLHLKIVPRCGRWFCSEIIARESLGYGTYLFTVDSRVDGLDPNATLGLFTWDTAAPQYHYREIDFEFGRWGDPASANSQYVIQPWEAAGNMLRFNINYLSGIDSTTHVMTWASEAISFQSYYGEACVVPSQSHVIRTWRYAGADNPPPGGENTRMNLWLINGDPPVNGRDVEAIISDFRYSSVPLADSDRDGIYNPCDICAGTIPGAVVDANGCPPFIPGDVDRDGDVDGADFTAFKDCISGSGISIAGSCSAMDFDGDGDVDQDDFGALQRCYSGTKTPADPGCGG